MYSNETFGTKAFEYKLYFLNINHWRFGNGPELYRNNMRVNEGKFWMKGSIIAAVVFNNNINPSFESLFYED